MITYTIVATYRGNVMAIYNSTALSLKIAMDIAKSHAGSAGEKWNWEIRIPEEVWEYRDETE